jgi:uncharacterized membrane protein
MAGLIRPNGNVNGKGIRIMMKKTVLSAAVFALILTLSGCGGSDTKTTVHSKETQGKQLLDLKEAYDKGVISEKEYENTKDDILDQD